MCTHLYVRQVVELVARLGVEVAHEHTADGAVADEERVAAHLRGCREAEMERGGEEMRGDVSEACGCREMQGETRGDRGEVRGESTCSSIVIIESSRMMRSM